jgi:UPF0755 protein
MEPAIEFQDINNKKKKIQIIALLAAIVFCYFIWSIFIPSFSFKKINPNGVYINIKNGMGARQVANLLYENDIILSPTAFVGLISFFGNENNINSGVYFFETGKSAWSAARIISEGEYNIQAKKITFPEGFTNRQIGDRLEANLPVFDKFKFMNLASTSEGYLYPETYFFLPSDTEEVIFKKMTSTFDDETSSLHEIFEKSEKSKHEIVIMASILEREVQSVEDKKLVSDILWSRIKIGMPLQVDATLAYERDKDSYTLTTADLKNDSPYNTYTRKGLPPTPISNPGFDSIRGALEPEANPYLYFLTDREGKVYYAKTYDEHLRNKAKYFNK